MASAVRWQEEDHSEETSGKGEKYWESGDRYAGTGASAAFLKEFADGYPWAHLDIAPMAFAAKGQPAKPYGPAGATGFGVRLMAALLENWQGD